eukprot:CAMPEP_0170521072 /NCGR_PEP_ID=MMETSP0209-20121228/6384_1 /TAXON_ID=665100 ORGANISM="Litonotus pictus, Strain P1" /NCGR_SAMPLE_ID=MMETSP0209 /ASSEMBLY_ACC=CAM_ASM_000301 /LENGTH=715 /DNA_ID=CAMNT_0010807717 /DNA_START=126 /DNA_END=2273 /DNA_ORIENTATION=+
MIMERVQDSSFMNHICFAKVSEDVGEFSKMLGQRELITQSYEQVLIKAAILSKIFQDTINKLTKPKDGLGIDQFRVGIFVNNSAEHMIADLACQLAECVSINYHINMSFEQIEYVTSTFKPDILVISLGNTIDDLDLKVNSILNGKSNDSNKRLSCLVMIEGERDNAPKVKWSSLSKSTDIVNYRKQVDCEYQRIVKGRKGDDTTITYMENYLQEKFIAKMKAPKDQSNDFSERDLENSTNCNTNLAYGVFFDLDIEEEMKFSVISQRTIAANLHSFHNTCFSPNEIKRLLCLPLFSLLETRILLYSFLHCGATISCLNSNIHYYQKDDVNIYSEMFWFFGYDTLEEEERGKTGEEDLKKYNTSFQKRMKEEIKELQATSIVVVPRLLVNLEKKIQAITRKFKGCAKNMYKKAMNSKIEKYEKEGVIVDSFYDPFCLYRLREEFGGRIENFICVNNFRGSNSLSPPICSSLKILFSVPIIEGVSTLDTGFVTFTNPEETLNQYLGNCCYSNTFKLVNTDKYVNFKVDSIKEPGYFGELDVQYFSNHSSKQTLSDHKSGLFCFISGQSNGLQVLSSNISNLKGIKRDDFSLLQKERTSSVMLEDMFLQEDVVEQLCVIPKERSEEYYFLIKPSDDILRRLLLTNGKEMYKHEETSKFYDDPDSLSAIENILRELEINKGKKNVKRIVILVKDFLPSHYDFYGNYNKKRIKRELLLD